MKHQRRVWGLVLLAALIVVVARRVVATVPGPCTGEQRALVVESARRVMTVCENGTPQQVFAVRIGWNGVGKTREGDRKTPLGRYPLGVPVGSRSFGTFVPIGFPTPEQRRAGLTGSAVGIHGPSRIGRFLGPLVNLVDTTDGCIGLASDTAARGIGRWVGERPEQATVLVR